LHRNVQQYEVLGLDVANSLLVSFFVVERKLRERVVFLGDCFSIERTGWLTVILNNQIRFKRKKKERKLKKSGGG
jgi:hypothetical protein